MSNSESKKNQFADVEALKRRFLLLNRERLRRAEDCMRANQRDFLDFLPLLFHINHPRLPGYVAKEIPCGICDYLPSERALAAANRYINRFEYKKRAMARYEILSMFLMGSSGTVAYSKKSDFDIWLCHQHGLSGEQLSDLQAKATAIEGWAAEQGLEVHFFLMDAENFKAGKIVDLSSESSGTAQYYLLLEEFYRTSLLLAGRYPAWWLVPVESEGNYDAYLRDLYDRRIVGEGEVVDFGGIPTIPAEEFFGAAVWQLFKGIDSPYKSVLKLLLMEVYAAEYPAIDLLCLRFKKAIYDGEFDLDRLDPYLMLYRRLEEYLLKRNEPERLELVRRCFYFKVNQKLGQPDPLQYDWRRDLLRSMTNAWGWEKEYLAVLDDRSGWKIRQVLKERGALVRELTYTYQFLSDFGRNYTQLAAINQYDLNALGRKLYAAFERKTGKVEIVNRGISQDVRESVLTLYQIRQEGRDGGWALLAEGGGESNDLASMVALKRGRHVMELLAWAYFNGLLTAATIIKVIRHDSFLAALEVEELVRELERILPAKRVLETSVEDLGRAVRILQAVVVVNLGRDPMVKSMRGQHLASNRTDAFSYGGMHENLVRSFDIVLLNSWKEVVTHHHAGAESVLASICNYFKLMPPSKGMEPPQPKVLCYSSNHRVTIQQRIERLFADLAACFYGGRERLNSRYIMQVERAYYVLHFEEDSLRHQMVPNYGELLRHLSKGRQSFGPVVIDRYALQETLLPLIFKYNKPGVVQLFYKENGTTADVYVLDENGSLFHQETEFFDGDLLLGHFRRFFDSALQRQYYQLAGLGGDPGGEIDVEYYQVSRNPQGQYHVVAREPGSSFERRGYLNVQVIAALDEGGHPAFTIYCQEMEFTTVEHGSELFREVASYVVKHRQGGQRYPIFITDIDLPVEMFEEYSGNRAPTADFLSYKKSIESKLNEALRSLDGTGGLFSLRPS